MVNNVKNMETLKKIVNIFYNICMILQIIIFTLIFICILYIIFGVFNNNMLDFLTPLMEGIKSFIISTFGTSIKESQDGIDGRLVLFILTGFLTSFFVIQLKMACELYSKKIDKKIIQIKENEEYKMNIELQSNMERRVAKQTSFLIAVQFRTKSLFKESYTSELHTEEDIVNSKNEAVNKFVKQMSDNHGIHLSKDGDILILYSDNINNVDDIVNKIQKVLNQIKAELKLKNIGIRAKIAIDSYITGTPVKTVYGKIKHLLDITSNNEILCLGNFKNRYNLIRNCQYVISIKGRYALNGNEEETVYNLMKKN